VAHNSISHTVRRVIIVECNQQVISTPTTTEEWLQTANGYSTKPRSLYGKHMAIKCLRNDGSKYFNHNKLHSIVSSSSLMVHQHDQAIQVIHAECSMTC